MLLLVALLQAFADGGYTVEVSPWLASLEKYSLSIWVYICRQCPAELPMLVALTIFVMLCSAARGETPAFLVAYSLVWAKLVCFKLEVGQPRTWHLLQALAQLGFVLVMLLYLVAPLEHPNNTPPVQLMYKVFPEVKYRQSLLRIVFPHLALALCAYMERLRIAKVAGLKHQGRLRADTLESIDTISSEIYNRSTTYWGTQKNRCLRSIMRYKVLVVAKLRKWTDELICIFVLALSFGAALVPGTDIHSLALLLGTGPALLMYNTRGTNRGRKLDCGYLILRFSTVLMFTFRITAASALIEWPDDRQWPIALGELGVVRPLWDPPMKVLLLGIIPVMARLAIIATIRVQREDADHRDEIIAHWQERMAEEEANAEVAKEVPIESMAVLEVHASVASPSHSEAYPSEIEAQIPDEHSGHTVDPPDAEETVSVQASPRNRKKSSVRFLSGGDHEAEARGETKGRRRENRARGPNMEERLLTWFIPSWMEFMPLNMHVYLSAILLVLVFALSIQEVNVLSFLMMLAVISLCGWSRRWVQAGNVFSCTTLAIMWLQYLARFRIFDDVATSAVWLQRLGLQWKTSQVEKHCAILVLCILQKQYWYRGRFSKVRPVVCPNFVADHADMAGFFGLIAVAVIRRHALSTLLVLGALPWVIREELPFKESEQRHAHTKWWLRWFRLVLFLILIVEVSLRLLLTFNLGDEMGRDQFVSWICDEYWGGKAHPNSLDSCRAEFARWIDSEANRRPGATPLMLMEFFCLFFLGIIQQLLECVALKREEAKTMQRKKLTVLYWWPLLVWLCTFTLSLARGTLLGLCFLLLLVGITFKSSSSLSTRRRWVWRARLCALLFLLIGLAFQSPLLPCSRAMCKNGVHQIYLTLDECAHVEALDLSLVGSEAASSTCFVSQNEAALDIAGVAQYSDALGHDTMWTLAVQILGIRRIKGDSIWEGILALFVSQLGQMVLLIVAATVQLRMYSSQLFSRYADVFVEEPEEVILARAQRFATEFYCGVKLEELASRHRLKALVEKLHRTKKKIQDLLRVNHDIGKNSRCAAMLKPASTKQVSDILKYANEKNLSIVPMLKDKESASKLEGQKCIWKPVLTDNLVELLKSANEETGATGVGPLHDELVLSVLRATQLDTLDERKSAITELQALLELPGDQQSVRNRIRYMMNKSREEEDVAVEELQLSCGLVKKDAEKVIKMFACNVAIGKQYAHLLKQITCGRLNADGIILRKEVQKLIDSVQLYQDSQQGPRRHNVGLFATNVSSTASLKVNTGQSGLRSRTESDPAMVKEEEENGCQVLWDRIKGFVGPYLKAIAEWWEGFKCSQLLARLIVDHAFLGLDEELYLVDAERVARDELCEHRRGNNLPRILWKILLSNAPILAALFCTLAFVLNRSVLDATRLLMVTFACLRLYPFPANWLWSFLKYFSAVLLVLRTLYDLPVVCAGFQLRQPRTPEEPRLLLEPEDSYQWCPVFTTIGIDILLGFAKRSTVSALESMEMWIDVVWADHLCICTILVHQWVLQRYGVGRFVTFDAQSQRLWLRRTMSQPGTPSSVIMASRASMAQEEVKLKDESLGTWGSNFRDSHTEMVKRWWGLRQTFITEFAAQEELFHQYQAQMEESSSDSESGEEETGKSRGSTRFSTITQGETKGDQTTRGSLSRSSTNQVESSIKMSRYQIRTGSMTSLDTALLMSSKSIIAYEWASEWAKSRGRRRGFFTSCRAPRDMDHVIPPRLLFPVIRQRENLNSDMDEEDEEEHRWNQAMRWAQVLAYRFLQRQVIECEICTMFVEPNERHWSCGPCGFRICKTCAIEIMQGRRPREKLMKPGVSLYTVKTLLGFFLLVYALLNNQAILKEEERSFSQSLQENNFSVATLLLTVAHMTILLSDRVFFKAHYSMRSHATLHVIELVNLVLILSEFVFLHYHTIATLWFSVNPREERMSLAHDWQLCVYYLAGMLYITVCMLQIKHGLPALGGDGLRPKSADMFSAANLYKEKVYYYVFMVYYNFPFLDDISVIVDWSVVPTSLDLWMYWKVEDAHTAFYRTRHLMFVRGQSYYAEQRDVLEKFYNGWAILCIVVLVMLMPIIVFSPFSPFPNTVLVEQANVVLGMTVASSCDGYDPSQLCRYVEMELYRAPAIQIQRSNSSATAQYLQDNPRVNTDIDIQDIKWPWFSQGALHASPAMLEEVQNILNKADRPEGGPAVAVAFDLRYRLQRSVLGLTSHTRSVCSCVPRSRCPDFAGPWPARIVELCNSGGVSSSLGFSQEVSISEPLDAVANETRSWWREAAQSSFQEATLVLPKLWSPRVNLGNAGLTERQDLRDFIYGLATQEVAPCNFTGPCSAAGSALRWGSLRSGNSSSGNLHLKVELEKSVNVQGVAGSSSDYTSALGLYVAVVLVLGRYLRGAFQGASKQAIYDEIPDVHVFLNLIEAIKMAREHGDLRVEFELYYCLMQVLRSTHILLRIGGHEPRNYGIGRVDRHPNAELALEVKKGDGHGND